MLFFLPDSFLNTLQSHWSSVSLWPPPNLFLSEGLCTYLDLFLQVFAWLTSFSFMSPHHVILTEKPSLVVSRVLVQNRRHAQIKVAEKSLLRPLGTSLVVQWLRLCAQNARGQGSLPGQGTRSNIVQPKSSHDLSEEDRRSCLLELRPSRS